MYYLNFIVREENEWNSYIKRSFEHEVYHTWYYHSLNKEGEPLLFVFEEEEFFIALPLIKREIKNSTFFDLTSVYGYSGPISNIDLAQLSNVTIQNFKNTFVKFMKEERCICIFSRLNPFLNQNYLLDNFGGVRDNGKTIYMDLTVPLQNQKIKYEKRLSRQIKKLREKEYQIIEANTENEIKKFTEMYCENMDRLNAASNYYFDEQYFTNLLNPKLGNKLILIYDGIELMCGALVLISNNIIRNHLSATSPLYLKESPSKLLTDEISMIGRRLGKKIFHLGGGVGGREDSLFHFKGHFSDLKIEDRVWCYVDDSIVYNELTALGGDDLESESKYFPLYRKSKKKLDLVNNYQTNI